MCQPCVSDANFGGLQCRPRNAGVDTEDAVSSNTMCLYFEPCNHKIQNTPASASSRLFRSQTLQPCTLSIIHDVGIQGPNHTPFISATGKRQRDDFLLLTAA